MALDMAKIKELREKTNVGIGDCKKALQETKGDIDKAVEFLRKKGMQTAQKKSARHASEGVIGSYIHSNQKIGVLVEIRCETDFVARTDEFQTLCKDVAMHIAASNPISLSREEIPADVVEAEKDIYRSQMKGKPENIIDNIIQGKLNKFYSEKCLLDQPFVKDPKGKLTVGNLIKESIPKLGENIQIKRFVRFELGEADEKAPEGGEEQAEAPKKEAKPAAKKEAKPSAKKEAKPAAKKDSDKKSGSKGKSKKKKK